ncbi:hypothetical protein QDR37_01255 [Amnibacterium sp. CER49]|uniref:hypothetical protein n=1 Tax=Amnibacterium sp. CER49 TaxID=3039161 RepID=UPI002448266F|nr:hypothetical protein [Amnibacterium sp. CER49]MDH2442561.1 hypothetical protein [Amnibacterium sp. CER49]
MRHALLAAAATAALTLGAATPALASNINNQQSRYPVDYTYTNPCTGETTYLTGFIEEVYSYQSPQHLSGRINIHVRGTTDTGVKYVGDQVRHFTASANGSHFVETFRLNRVGSSPSNADEVARRTIQVRYADGKLVVDRTVDFDHCT